MGKIKNRIKLIISALKYGGYSEIHIAQLEYGKCLAGKKILITGGTSGIGFEIAKKCVNSGAQVIVTGRNEKKLQNAIRILGANVKGIVWDISDIAILHERLQEVISLFDGEINCLINNAGVQPNLFFPNVTAEEFDRVYNVNSKAVFLLSQAICKFWVEEKSPLYRKIINIDSQGGFVGATYPYRMTKWDVRGLTRGLGLSMVKNGILVNAIAPGVVKTDMQTQAMQQGDNSFCLQNPIKRVSLPEEVAELAVFMLSDACNYMVGQTILIDGGYSLI